MRTEQDQPESASRRRRRTAFTIVLTGAMAIGLGLAVAPAARAVGPRPDFQLPFSCGQLWRIDSYDSSHAPALDMVREPQSATEGSLYLAPADGVVVRSDFDAQAGNIVQVNHGGQWFTTGIHLQSRSVSPGQRVEQGQQLGRVGHTGSRSNGTPHLHFELAVDANNDGRASFGAPGTERVPAWFDGRQYGSRTGETFRNVPSRNCGPVIPHVSRPASVRTDLNGDGREDLAVFNDSGGGGLRLFVEYGGQTGLQQVWDAPNWGYPVSSMRFVSGRFGFSPGGDIAGVLDHGGGHVAVWVWKGSALGTPFRSIDLPTWGVPVNNSRFTTGDYNNDTLTDIAWFSDLGGGHLRQHVIYGGQWNLGTQQVWDAPNWGYPITSMQLIPEPA